MDYEFFVDDPGPPKRAWKQWHVIQVPKDNFLYVWPMLPVYWSMKCHFDNRSRVCSGDGCEYCERALPVRLANFLPVRLGNGVANAVLQMPTDFAVKLKNMDDLPASWDHCRFKLQRTRPGRNTPISLAEVTVSQDLPRSYSTEGHVESALHVLGVDRNQIQELASRIYESVNKVAAVARRAPDTAVAVNAEEKMAAKEKVEKKKAD